MDQEITISVDKAKEYASTISETVCFFQSMGNMIKRHTAAKAYQGHGEPFTDAELEGLAYGFDPILTNLSFIVDELDSIRLQSAKEIQVKAHVNHILNSTVDH